jgi:2-amino-4-hydroxy-6-hydroxymethyldihydropteridine diphosphokinase
MALLRAAAERLAALPLANPRISSVYQTAPQDFADQPDFLNAVLLGESAAAPEQLLADALRIEAELGRERRQPKGPRVIDIDLIAVGDERREGSELTLPHPRAHRRAFVLLPWLELDPQAALVGHGPVATMAAALGDQRVLRREDLELRL